MIRRTSLFCLIVYFFRIVQALHLSSHQITSIRNLIQHPKMTPNHRHALNQLLYKSYEKWAISKAVEFKSLHKHKCRNIDIAELVFASKIGLFKSIQKYNGKYDLLNYSSMFVRSELLSVVTDTYSMSIYPKRIRCKNKSGGFNEIDAYRYNHLLTVQPFSMYEPWKIELCYSRRNDVSSFVGELSYSRRNDVRSFVGELVGALQHTSSVNTVEKYETTDTIHAYLDKQPLFIKRLFLLYMNHFSKTNRMPSRKYMAEMMCCSEETIRQKLRD
jgi:hypothetical protein